MTAGRTFLATREAAALLNVSRSRFHHIARTYKIPRYGKPAERMWKIGDLARVSAARQQVVMRTASRTARHDVG